MSGLLARRALAAMVLGGSQDDLLGAVAEPYNG